MLRYRVIPCLLLDGNRLVKTVEFKNAKYVGDPINAVRIFNEKEVDELIFLDISASRNNREPNFIKIEEIAKECFMPLCYGGGITCIDHMERLFDLGIEKVSLNSAVSSDLSLVKKAAEIFGSQSVVVSIDVRQTWLGGYDVVQHSSGKKIKIGIQEYAEQIQDAGAGELFLNAIHRDGTGKGYDLQLIEQVAAATRIPLVACGGAGGLADFTAALDAGATAVAAGSLFVFYGKHRAVLINYPSQDELRQYVGDVGGRL